MHPVGHEPWWEEAMESGNYEWSGSFVYSYIKIWAFIHMDQRKSKNRKFWILKFASLQWIFVEFRAIPLTPFVDVNAGAQEGLRGETPLHKLDPRLNAILVGSLLGWNTHVYIYINICMYVYIYIYICISICIHIGIDNILDLDNVWLFLFAQPRYVFS